MTTNEIKSAWNTFKKESKKEISFSMNGCCYMNAKQIANGTATIYLCNDIEYADEIKYHHNSIEKVNAYDTWTSEEKKRHEDYELDMIERYERLQTTYGTRANEAKIKAEEITSSAAFKKLVKAISIQHHEVEFIHKWEGLNAYQIRIHY